MGTLRQAAQLLRPPPEGPHGRPVVRAHDLSRLVVRAARAIPLQVDGEPMGARTELTLTAVPAALRIVV